MEKWQQGLLLLALACVLLIAVFSWIWDRCLPSKRWQRWWRLMGLIVSTLAGVFIPVLATHYWYKHRPQPAPSVRYSFGSISQPNQARETLFAGVSYLREVQLPPKPVVIHVLTVQLDTPGLGFLVTPGDPAKKLPLVARTTSAFAKEFGVQVAVNGDFFHPWHSNGPWDYYPHVNDPVAVYGLAASKGTLYATGEGTESLQTLYISEKNVASFVRPDGPIYNAISGDVILVREGKPAPEKRPSFLAQEPRTGFGLSQDERELIVVVVDGRQPGYSEGVTVPELANILARYGAYTAVNVDGGGSSSLVAQTGRGKWKPLNCPIHTRIPWRQRPIGNHLGIFARAAVSGDK